MSTPGEFDDHLGGLPSQVWDGLAADHLYSTSDWLRFCARDIGGTIAAGTVHVSRPDGGIGAAVPVTAVVDEPNGFYRWASVLGGAGLPSPGPVGLMAGQRRGYQTHVLTGDGEALKTPDAERLLDRLRELSSGLTDTGLLSGTRPGPVPCVAPFLTTADALALREAGARAHPVLWATDAWIPVEVEDWNAWVATFASKKRRDNLKREVREFRKAGYTITRAPLSECCGAAAELLAATQKRYDQPYDLDTLTESFRRQADAMGEAAQVLFCSRGGEPPVGFCLFYVHGTTLSIRAVGFDYPELQTGAAEYFNLVYHEPVRIATELGLAWIHPGIEAPDAKARRGARLMPLWTLDLTEDSVQHGHDEPIRRHNAERLRSVAELSPVADKQIDADLFAPFC